MSFWGFMGFVAGIVAGAAILLVAPARWHRPGGVLGSDEMTHEMHKNAAAFSFYAAGALAFVGWVTDNVLRHLRGEDVEALSPWGIMFCAMAYLLVISNLVIYRRQTGESVTSKWEPAGGHARVRLICLGGSVIMFAAMASSMNELTYVFLPLGALSLVIGIMVSVRGRRNDGGAA